MGEKANSLVTLLHLAFVLVLLLQGVLWPYSHCVSNAILIWECDCDTSYSTYFRNGHTVVLYMTFNAFIMKYTIVQPD